ncbi:(d)CMP kinase [Halarsenatibacter silvermanii]|uniref:Cytidylate kinase n=1 Tax=Halarsenatibacter silvermanii TaxID=321763 RepID=A0A1G9NTR3_9FIRM|nr:(d)CMP kinase [Halarsenatibacter silvermanii]SDL89988.1 cytidylate kinase [Halarsenatibacter silvermanii]
MEISIAIDGPSGSGKSTTARRVAQRLNIYYIDTGAMYRAVALLSMRKNIDLEDKDEISRLSKETNIEFGQITGEDSQKVFLNNEEVTDLIRTNEVDEIVSEVASIPEVREIMLNKQRELARKSGVVMEGRDIGSRVLPGADLKIYLTASLNTRARRRFRELKEKGKQIDFAKVKDNIRLRDEQDKSRSHSPLVRPDDAIEIKTDDFGPNKVVEKIIELIKKEV